MIPKPPENTRGFFDPDKLRANVLEAARSEYEKKLNTIESHGFKLQASNVHYPEPDKQYSIDEQKQAILEKRDLSVPLKAKIDMIDKKTGNVVDSKELVIARIPAISPRSTVIMGGVEYMPINQSRLKPGIYSRKNAAGLPESMLNIAQGTGVGGRLTYQPDTSQFHFKVQNSNFHLYSLLHDMGISDKDLEQDWGKEILQRNALKYEPNTIDKLHAKLFEKFS